MMTRLVVYAVAVLAILVAAAIYTKAVYDAGGAAIREQNLKAANQSIRQMEKDNVEIRNLDTDAYCREFGFEWLPDKGECG